MRRLTVSASSPDILCIPFERFLARLIVRVKGDRGGDAAVALEVGHHEARVGALGFVLETRDHPAHARRSGAA